MKLALLAGTQSGCGKTTVMLALLQYLISKEKSIVSFKAGPDFLDPVWHQLITRQVCYNLDTRMIGLQQSTALINKQQNKAEIALIEGVMGLFDGRAGVGQDGSSADLAKGLNCPVILVVNAKGISGSIVALVSGYCDYANKMGVTISAIIANFVGSAHHAKLLKNFLHDYQLPPLLAWMEKEAPTLTERHLGLVMPDQAEVADFLPTFHVDDELLSDVFFDSSTGAKEYHQQQKRLLGKTVAIAKDAVCCFIYQANIDWLLGQGVEIIYFSVLNGDPVPSIADAVWLPGGYPELYAQALSVSASWNSLIQFIEAGNPVLAECGGAMLLGKQLIDLTGDSWTMAGILPFESRMQKKLASLGYREESSGLTGHEFHYSKRETKEDIATCFECDRGDQGMRYKNLRASYIHWYFASNPEMMVKILSHN